MSLRANKGREKCSSSEQVCNTILLLTWPHVYEHGLRAGYVRHLWLIARVDGWRIAGGNRATSQEPLSAKHKIHNLAAELQRFVGKSEQWFKLRLQWLVTMLTTLGTSTDLGYIFWKFEINQMTNAFADAHWLRYSNAADLSSRVSVQFEKISYN